jgi:hypothetical protein
VAQHKSLLILTLALGTVLGILFQQQSRLNEIVSSAQPDYLSAAYLRLLLKMHPDDASLRLRLVQQLRELGRLDDALENLKPLLTKSGPEAAQAQCYPLELVDTTPRVEQPGPSSKREASGPETNWQP